MAVTTREGTTGLAGRRGLSLRLPPRGLPGGGRSSKGNSRHTSWRAATQAKNENAHLACGGRSLPLGTWAACAQRGPPTFGVRRQVAAGRRGGSAPAPASAASMQGVELLAFAIGIFR